MDHGLLQLNDFKTQFFTASGEPYSTPGQVIFRGNALLVGEVTQTQNRLNPALTYNQHWQQLNQQVVSLPNPAFRHHADIAYQQLQQWLVYYDKNLPLLVATSYDYSKEQYALLAGLLQAHNVQVVGFTDSALIQSVGYLHSQPLTSQRFYHVDINLHQMRLTQLQQRAGMLEATQHWDLTELGVSTLLNQWQRILTRECIRQTRYDPLHSAESEQRLYNQLLPSIKQLNAAASIELAIDGNTVDVKKTLLDAIAGDFATAVSKLVGTAPVLIAPTVRDFPGLSGTQIEHQHIQQGLKAQADYLSQQTTLKHYQALPITGAGINSAPVESSASAQPSHLLFMNRALPLQQGLSLPLGDGKACDLTESPTVATIVQENGCWEIVPTANQVSINGLRLNKPKPLNLGDTITWSGSSTALLCISVDGASRGT